MNKVNIDGIQYDAAPEVDRALTKALDGAKLLSEQLAAANKRADEAEARSDEHKARADAAEKTAKEAKDGIGDAVKARVALHATASKFLGNQDVSDKSDRDVMVAVIATKHKGFDAAGKSDDYVRARFDAVIELGGVSPQLVQAAGGHVTQHADTSHADQAAESAAWSKSIDNFNSWRNN